MAEFFAKSIGALFCFFFVCSSLHGAPFPIPIQSESAIVINGRTGKVIYEKNAHHKYYPASITKIATAIYMIEKYPQDMQKMLTASQEALGWVSETEKARDNYNRYPSHWMETGASHIGLKRGESLSVLDLLYGLMLASGDDAANVLAEYAGGGSIPQFVKNLNSYLQQLGCSNTYFVNPHGLHHPHHTTTCADIANLARHAMKNELFREIVKTVRYERPQTNMQQKTMFAQTNKLICPGSPYYYKYAVGIKTGYISKAKHTLTCAAEKDGRLLIAVYMRCPERGIKFQEAKVVFEEAFKQKPVEKVVLAAGDQSFSRRVPGAFHSLKTKLQKPLILRYFPQEMPEIRCQLQWDPVQLPIAAGSKVGEVMLLVDGIYAEKIPLYASCDVEQSVAITMCNALLSKPVIITILLLFAIFLFVWAKRLR